jgi:hypothetical protein
VTDPDENIAAALRVFAAQLREAAASVALGPSSTGKSAARREQLHQIAQGIELVAENSRSAVLSGIRSSAR